MKNSVEVLKSLSLFLFFLLIQREFIQAQTNPCTQDTAFHIVVLGSSTAAGTGANPSDSSWVNRYRAHLQGLNPAYQVSNLAVGGFTTYRIMPTGYTPPPGRPAPDTTQNITAGLALNPDAIIVNLPSNDVANGFTVAEQLANFDTIRDLSLAAGVPIWICTTQPRNFGGNTNNIQLQIETRDSIWARYGPFVLDFWSGVVDTNGQINPIYDSGDGVHLNNGGHYLLFQEAVAADLPAALYLPPPYPDYTPLEITALNSSLCGDAQAEYVLEVLNRGQNDSLPFVVQLSVDHPTLGNISNQTFNFGSGLVTCTTDSMTFNINTLVGGTYEFTAIVQAGGDGNSVNDTLQWTDMILGEPLPTVQGDTGCGNANLLLQAIANPGDSLRWYDAAVAGNLVATGSQLPVSNLGSSTTFYVEAIRGDFFFRNELTTTYNSNINWNGAMFDLMADSAMVLDSFALKINSPGSQTVEVYTKTGTHLGFETNAGAWTLQGAFPVQVTNAGDVRSVGPLSLNLNVGDTLGVYLQLQNSASDLSYQSVSTPITRSNNELSITTGSGASHNFGGNFFPRDWNGTVYYHFGTKPDGDCLGPRVPVEATISDPVVNLGNDTILNVNSSLVLDAGAGFVNYQWSLGGNGQTLQLDGNVLGTGIYTVVVQITDSAGCTAMDTIIVVFAPLVGISDPTEEELIAWPIPADQGFEVLVPPNCTAIELWSLNGKRIGMWSVNPGQNARIETTQLPAGTYWLKPVGGSACGKMISILH